MTPDGQDLIQRRQRARARVMALLLGAFVVLVFAISIVKIAQGARKTPVAHHAVRP